MMRHINEVLNSIRERADDDLPYFSQIFLNAAAKVELVHFTKPYEEFFWHCATTIPNWLPRVVAACATTEGNGAHGLLDIWSRVEGHPAAEAGLLQHAKDEAAHARLFVKLAQLAFPENYAEDSLDTLAESLRPITKALIVKSTGPKISERMLLDYMTQLNIVEIRTRYHLHLLAPMYYSLAPNNKKTQVEKILSGLARDELSHICYTARVIDDYARDQNIERMTGVYMCRMHNYNEHTLEHCDAAKHDYGQGKYPMLFAPSCGGVCKLRADSQLE
jgi:hypothetical protein